MAQVRKRTSSLFPMSVLSRRHARRALLIASGCFIFENCKRLDPQYNNTHEHRLTNSQHGFDGACASEKPSSVVANHTGISEVGQLRRLYRRVQLFHPIIPIREVILFDCLR